MLAAPSPRKGTVKSRREIIELTGPSDAPFVGFGRDTVKPKAYRLPILPFWFVVFSDEHDKNSGMDQLKVTVPAVFIMLCAAGKAAEALESEGSIQPLSLTEPQPVFIAGAAVQWLRDGLRLFKEAPEVEALAARSNADQPVVFVPGFVGLGALHWAPKAREVLFGLTRDTSAADLGRATLEGVAYQVADLIDAAGARVHSLRVDGGMARNAWFLRQQGAPTCFGIATERCAGVRPPCGACSLGVRPDRGDIPRLAQGQPPFWARMVDKREKIRRFGRPCQPGSTWRYPAIPRQLLVG
jgi:hypothetical protein